MHTSHLLHISPYTFFAYIARAEYFLIPDDPVDRRKLFLIMLLKDNMNRLFYTNLSANLFEEGW